MDLWIRSQDKEDLVNSPLRVYYDKNYEEVHQLKANTYDETICLGTYKTKERALEVLDEIQKLDINNNSNVEVVWYFSTLIKITYNMPEE